MLLVQKVHGEDGERRVSIHVTNYSIWCVHIGGLSNRFCLPWQHTCIRLVEGMLIC